SPDEVAAEDRRNRKESALHYRRTPQAEGRGPSRWLRSQNRRSETRPTRTFAPGASQRRYRRECQQSTGESHLYRGRKPRTGYEPRQEELAIAANSLALC